MKLHFIQKDPWVTPGEYLAWAERNAYEVSFTRCWLYEKLPNNADADLLVVLGGYQCPLTTIEECAYFDSAAEQNLIRQYVEAGKAVVGVCLGAQLVGEALGAPYSHSPEKEIGTVKARLTAAGKEDPFLKAFPDEFDAGEWHNDMPGLTAESVILAESDGCPRQIVRYGTFVYGFQTHMEFTREIIAAGLEDIGGEFHAAGSYIETPQDLLSYDYSKMNRLLSGFLDAMMGDYVIVKTILALGSFEFAYQGRTYLIQAESNKGWDYLSLWRSAPDYICLNRVFFDGIEGVSEETIRELFDQPFSDEHTVREIIQSPETEWRKAAWNDPS